MADFVLTLGDFAFQDKEVPEKIAVGGSHKLVDHELIGGIRVVDALGRIDDDLEWTGWMLGVNAGSRRAFLDAYRVAGTTLTLTWADFRYQVKVQTFIADFRRTYEFFYRISLKIIADLTSVSTAGTAVSLDDAVTGDLNTANDLAGSVNDSTLTPLMANLSSSIGAVATFSGAAPSTINSVLQPLAAVTQRVAVMQATNDVSIEAAPGLSGVFAGGSGAGMAAAFTGQLATVQQQTSLAQLAGLLGRMNQNLSSAGSSDNTVIVAGGNLFSVAATQYGDAADWTAIAQANGLSDPFITGTQELVIPAVPDGADGVLAS